MLRLGAYGPLATLRPTIPPFSVSLKNRLAIAEEGHGILMRTTVFASTLEARVSERAVEPKRALIARLAGMERSFWSVLGESVQARLHRRPTLGMEWLCLQGALWEASGRPGPVPRRYRSRASRVSSG